MLNNINPFFKKGGDAYRTGDCVEVLGYLSKNQENTPISTQSKVKYYNYRGATDIYLSNYEDAVYDLSWAIDHRQEMVTKENNQYTWVPLTSSSDYFWRGQV